MGRYFRASTEWGPEEHVRPHASVLSGPRRSAMQRILP